MIPRKLLIYASIAFLTTFFFVSIINVGIVRFNASLNEALTTQVLLGVLIYIIIIGVMVAREKRKLQ